MTTSLCTLGAIPFTGDRPIGRHIKVEKHGKDLSNKTCWILYKQTGAGDFSPLQSAHTDSGVHPYPYTVGTVDFSRG